MLVGTSKLSFYRPSRYLSQEDVLDQSNPFVQLVSGAVWLLRNGENYINQSLKAECDKTVDTGKAADKMCMVQKGFCSLCVKSHVKKRAICRQPIRLYRSEGTEEEKFCGEHNIYCQRMQK